MERFSRPRLMSISSSLATDMDLRGHRTDDVVCCEMSKRRECIYTASSEFIPLFLKGCCLKMVMELISKRSIVHLWNEMKF